MAEEDREEEQEVRQDLEIVSQTDAEGEGGRRTIRQALD